MNRNDLTTFLMRLTEFILEEELEFNDNESSIHSGISSEEENLNKLDMRTIQQTADDFHAKFRNRGFDLRPTIDCTQTINNNNYIPPVDELTRRVNRITNNYIQVLQSTNNNAWEQIPNFPLRLPQILGQLFIQIYGMEFNMQHLQSLIFGIFYILLTGNIPFIATLNFASNLIIQGIQRWSINGQSQLNETIETDSLIKELEEYLVNYDYFLKEQKNSKNKIEELKNTQNKYTYKYKKDPWNVTDFFTQVSAIRNEMRDKELKIAEKAIKLMKKKGMSENYDNYKKKQNDKKIKTLNDDAVPSNARDALNRMFNYWLEQFIYSQKDDFLHTLQEFLTWIKKK